MVVLAIVVTALLIPATAEAQRWGGERATEKSFREEEVATDGWAHVDPALRCMVVVLREVGRATPRDSSRPVDRRHR